MWQFLNKAFPKKNVGNYLFMQRHILSLNIKREKVNKNYVTLQPHVHFEEKFSEMEELKNNIEIRKLKIDALEIFDKYQRYMKLQSQLENLESQREDITTQLKQLLLESPNFADEYHSLKEQGKALREKVKIIKQNLYHVEDDFMHSFLNLPNELHVACPQINDNIMYTTCKEPCEKGPCHLTRKDLIDFKNENLYYLHGDAAIFDLRIVQATLDYFIEQGGFMQIANPDFVRCILLEANTTPVNHYHQVIEENSHNKMNKAYLTGGGTFESFLGALTKLSVYPSILPLRWISSGRIYQKFKNNMTSCNLFNAMQTNAVQTMVATKTPEEADTQMEVLLNLVKNIYNGLNLPFRLVYTNASKLLAAESLRVSIEVYSSHQNRYICMGHVSFYGNFLSKRILFNTRELDKYYFPYILGGPILCTSRLIGALIEHNISLQSFQFET